MLFRGTLLGLAILLSLVLPPSSSHAAAGDVTWHQSDDGPGHSIDSGTTVIASPDGARVYVAGWATSVNNHENAVVKAYDAITGAPLWSRSYDGRRHGTDLFRDAALSADGSVLYATGFSKGVGTNFDFITEAISTDDGARLWVTRYAGPARSDDEAEAIAVDQSGSRVFVGGFAGGVGGVVTAYSAASGAELWRWSNASAWIFDIEVGSAGQAVFVGKMKGDNYIAARRGRTGKAIWSHRVGGDGYEVSEHLALTPDGGTAFMGGWVRDDTTGDDAVVSAYDVATGTSLWSHSYDDASHGNNHVWALASAADGSGVFVSNGSYPAAGRLQLLAIDDGTPDWGVSTPDSPIELAIGPPGFVMGMAEGGETGRDYLAIPYDAATGAPAAWFGTWTSSSGDPKDIAVTPDGGTVLVTGGAADDLTTVAFNTS